MKYYISRAFVEFGPFAEAEIADFGKRGLLKPGDYLRKAHSTDWTHWEDWKAPGEAEAAKPAAAKPAAKKKAAPAAKKKAAPAKSAAKKKAAPPSGT